jgi:copper chaperone CopZ
MNTQTTISTLSSAQRITLPLFNVGCSSDAQIVEQVLRRQPGVTMVYANAVTEKVYIEYEATLTNPDQLRAVLQKAGFAQKSPQVTCGRCQ